MLDVLQLEQTIKRLKADSTLETRVFEHQGQRCVFKPARAKTWPGVRACLSALACWAVFGERVSVALLRTGGIAHEAVRLRQLKQAGHRVPDVLWQDDACLVLSDVGVSLDTAVNGLDETALIHLFTRVMADLADWHQQGSWHGGAQLRNVTLYPDGLLEGELYRIDFEEIHGNALSWAATAVYDVFLFLGDALLHLPTDQAVSTGQHLLDNYLTRTANPEVERLLKRLLRGLRPVLWLGKHWPRLLRKRDIQRAWLFARVLQVTLPVRVGT